VPGPVQYVHRLGGHDFKKAKGFDEMGMYTHLKIRKTELL
jgi:hypothetical protein